MASCIFLFGDLTRRITPKGIAMAYSTKEGTYISGGLVASMAVNQAALEVRNCFSGSLILVWASAAAMDAVVKLQESIDQITWIDISGQTQTLSAPTGSKKFAIADVNLPYLRAVVTKNTESTATIDLKYYFKGK